MTSALMLLFFLGKPALKLYCINFIIIIDYRFFLYIMLTWHILSSPEAMWDAQSIHMLYSN